VEEIYGMKLETFYLIEDVSFRFKRKKTKNCEEQSVSSLCGGISSSADLSFSSKYRGEWINCVESSGPKWEKVSPEQWLVASESAGN